MPSPSPPHGKLLPNPPWARWWGPAVTLAVLAVVLSWALWPLFTLAHVPKWDGMAFYGPALSMVADHLRAGELLLWNPWVGGGRPDAADPQVGAFSPYVLAMALLTGGGFRGYALSLALAWWLAPVGVLLLGRHLRAPAWGAIAAAAAFATCGFFISHLEHVTFTLAMAAVPWITWRLDAALCRRSALAAIQAGAIWGVAGLGGYPGVTICTAAWMGLWAAGRWLLGDEEGARPDLATAARTLLLAVALGAVVLSPTYLAFFVEGKAFTARTSALPRASAVEQHALPAGALRTFASPSIPVMKAEETRRLWPETNHGMVSVHFGLASTALASAAALMAFAAPGNRFRLAVVAAGAFFLAASLGSALPLRGWLYDWVPPMRFFRYTAFQRGFGLFALAVLALWGSRDLESESRSVRRRACLALGGAGIVLAAVATKALRDVFAATAHLHRSLAGELAWVFAATAAVALLAGLAGGDRLAPGRLGVAFAALVVVEATRTLAVSPTLLTVERPPKFVYLLDLETGRPRAPSLTLDRGAGVRIANNLNLLAGEALFPGYEPMTSPQLATWVSDARLTSWVLGADRIWFAPHAAARGAGEGDLAAFVEETAEAGGPLLWVHDLGPAADPRPADRLARIPVELLDYRQRDLAFRVDAPSAGWLWITDRYAPGWEASIDGAKTRVHHANFLFRAVEVPAGRHLVRMRYTPFGYPWLTATSWGLLLAVAVLTWRRRPRQGAQ